MKPRVSAMENRKARFDYHFIELWTAGVSLMGSEVKSIKEGLVDFTGSWCELTDTGVLCHDLHVTEKSTAFTHPVKRVRQLLLTKKEIKRIGRLMDTGLTIVPVKIFVSDRGLIKMQIALAKGKKTWDKRETIKARDLERFS